MDKQKVEEFMRRDHLADVKQAAANLQGILLPTHLMRSGFFSNEYNCEVYIKPENLQRTGSFKIRGAYNKISNLTPEESVLLRLRPATMRRAVRFRHVRRALRPRLLCLT